MLLDKVICMGGTNRIGTNTCHHNKKLNQRLDYLHLFWDLSKSLINEYSDSFYVLCYDLIAECKFNKAEHQFESTYKETNEYVLRILTWNSRAVVPEGRTYILSR